MGWHALIIHTRGFDYQGLHRLHDEQGLVANHCANTFKLMLMACSAWNISLDAQSDWQFSYRPRCLLPIPKLRFEQHCSKLVGDGSLATLLVNHGIKSLSALAFASGTPAVTANRGTIQRVCNTGEWRSGHEFWYASAPQTSAFRSRCNSDGWVEITCNGHYTRWG